jgi:hypothetical protein
MDGRKRYRHEEEEKTLSRRFEWSVAGTDRTFEGERAEQSG